MAPAIGAAVAFFETGGIVGIPAANGSLVAFGGMVGIPADAAAGAKAAASAATVVFVAANPARLEALPGAPAASASEALPGALDTLSTG
jgi:hypothetical protein